MSRLLPVVALLFTGVGCFATEFQALEGRWEGACTSYQGEVYAMGFDLTIQEGSGSGTGEITLDHPITMDTIEVVQGEAADAKCEKESDFAIDGHIDDPETTLDQWMYLCVAYPEYERGVLKGFCDIHWEAEADSGNIYADDGEVRLYQQ